MTARAFDDKNVDTRMRRCVHTTTAPRKRRLTNAERDARYEEETLRQRRAKAPRLAQVIDEMDAELVRLTGPGASVEFEQRYYALLFHRSILADWLTRDRPDLSEEDVQEWRQRIGGGR